MAPSPIETHPLEIVLDKVIHDRGFDRKMLEQRALVLWADVVGPRAARHTQPTVVTGGVLRVTVSDAVWMTEMNFCKPRLIRQLNQRLGAEILRDIVFRVGVFQERIEEEMRPARQRGAKVAELEAVELDPEEEAYIEQIVTDVEDEELRETLKRVFTKQGKLSKLREQEYDDSQE